MAETDPSISDTSGAETYLRCALAYQEERGAALEAARTRQILARALVTKAGGSVMPHEARTLLTQARAQFGTSGAALDLARAGRQAAEWHLQ